MPSQNNQINPHQPVIVIAGPTAVGKTTISEALCLLHPDWEIINGDVYQCYQELNIGVDKQLPQINPDRYHLFSCQTVKEPISIYTYQQWVRMTINKIHARQHIPVLVGGSVLYLLASVLDYQFQIYPQTPAITAWFEQLKAKSLSELWALWQENAGPTTDPELAFNRHRLENGLKHWFLTKTFPSQTKQPPTAFYQQLIWLQLTAPKPFLLEQCNLRLDKQWSNAWKSEVETLLTLVDIDHQAFKAIGYREIAKMLTEQTTWAETKPKILIKLKALIKKQNTFLRKVSQHAHVIDVQSTSLTKINHQLENWLSNQTVIS